MWAQSFTFLCVRQEHVFHKYGKIYKLNPTFIENSTLKMGIGTYT